MSNPHPRSRTAHNGPAHNGPANMWPLRPVIGVAAIALLSIASLGCSAGEDAGPTRSTTVPPRLATTTIATSPSGITPATATGITPLVPATSTPTSATQTVDEAAQEILAVENAYRAGMAAIDLATAEPVDPDHPALEATLADGMLVDWKQVVAGWRSDGIAARPGTQNLSAIDIRSVVTSPGYAKIETCEVDDGVLYRVANGSISDDDVSTAVVDAELRRFDGVWKIVARVPRTVENGRSTCPA